MKHAVKNFYSNVLDWLNHRIVELTIHKIIDPSQTGWVFIVILF